MQQDEAASYQALQDLIQRVREYFDELGDLSPSQLAERFGVTMERSGGSEKDRPMAVISDLNDRFAPVEFSLSGKTWEIHLPGVEGARVDLPKLMPRSLSDYLEGDRHQLTSVQHSRLQKQVLACLSKALGIYETQVIDRSLLAMVRECRPQLAELIDQVAADPDLRRELEDKAVYIQEVYAFMEEACQPQPEPAAPMAT